MKSSNSSLMEQLAQQLITGQLLDIVKKWKKEAEDSPESLKLPVTRAEFLIWGTWTLMKHISSPFNSLSQTLEESMGTGKMSELEESLERFLSSQIQKSDGTTPSSTIPSSENME